MNGKPLTVAPTGEPLYHFFGNRRQQLQFQWLDWIRDARELRDEGFTLLHDPRLVPENPGGTNVLAVRARDRGSVNYVDVNVVANQPAPPPPPTF